MEELQNLTPLYNKEFYLAYLCGEDVELPIPDGNTEHYLAYLCGMDVPIPDPLYTKEFYLAYKCGMDVELPEPGPYRIDQYLAKWCGMDVEVPEPMYRIEYWLAQLANSGELKTVSGNPISISDALAKPAESLSIEILPQQDLHGYSNPWPAGGGKNLLNIPDFPATEYHGITFSCTNGVLSANGTADANIVFNLKPLAEDSYTSIDNIFDVTADASYVLSGCTAGAYNSTYWLQLLVNGSGSEPRSATGDSAAFSFTAEQISSQQRRLAFRVKSGVTLNNLKIYPMIRFASISDATFAPYSNLCPITGWTGVNIPRTGKNLFDKSSAGRTSSNMWLGSATQNGSPDGSFILAAADYTLTSSEALSGLYVVGPNGNIKVAYNNTTLKFTLSATTAIKVLLYKAGASEDYWDTVDVQLELGSTATAYEPYNGTTYSIDWQDEAGTAYGGELDVVSGVLTAVPYYGSYNGETLVGPWVSSMDKYVAGTTPTIGAQVVDLGGTGTEVQLTPTEIQMLLGNNVLWNDINGDMTLEYLADGPADDVNALQILLGNRYVNNGEPDEASDREALDILLGGNTR